MKKNALCILVLLMVTFLPACTRMQKAAAAETSVPEETQVSADNAVEKYLMENYDGNFVLWCPDGHDLYAYYFTRITQNEDAIC